MNCSGPHEEAGSAETLPPPPPPVVLPPLLLLFPPPQPAAIRASAPTHERSSPIETRFLTLPPPSPVSVSCPRRGPPARPEIGFVGGSIETTADAFNFQEFDGAAATLDRSRSGGTGRRAGLKIRWGASPVWVRFPPSALIRRRPYDARMKVGVLTGGGDCPGLNAVIRAVARRSFSTRARGGRRPRRLARARRRTTSSRSTAREVSGLLPRGGTILGTSRTNPYKIDGGVERGAARTSPSAGLDALVAIGGEDTLGVAARLLRRARVPGRRRPEDDRQRPLGDRLHVRLRHRGLDRTEAIDRLHTTAESHNRVMVVEVMGRHTGWIAVMSGIAGGADVILIPEQPITRRGGVRASSRKRHERGKDFSIVVVSEGYELTYESGEQREVTQEARLDAVRARAPRRRRRRSSRARSRSGPASRRA